MDDSTLTPYQAPQQKRLELLMGDRVLPGNMTILQAVRHYSLPNRLAQSGVQAQDVDAVSLAAGIWVNTHTIW